MIGVIHLKNINDPFSAGYINTFVLGVVIKIVRIFGARQSHNHPTRSSVKHSKTRRFAYAYE